MPYENINIKSRLQNQLNDPAFKEAFERVEIEYELIEQIVLARRAKSITQVRLAEITGVSQQAISRLEKEKHLPKLDTLIKIVDGLGMKLVIKER